MTQRKLDDLFSLTPSSSTRSGKRSRINQTTTNDRDEFDDIFETNSSIKRRRTNNNSKQSTDVFDFDVPSTSSTSTSKKPENEKLTGSLKKKRSVIDDDDENKAIDELFNNDTRKKLRRSIKQEESTDLLDMFKTRTNINIPPQTISTIEDFKTPICPKISTTQKKIKMFFDDSDLILLREQANEQNDIKDYVHVKPVLVTGGQWLSKEAERKPKCELIEPSDNPTIDSTIPDDQRNLMHIQYAPLIVDDEIDSNKKSKGSKRTSLTRKSSKKVLDGKSFHKQLILSDPSIVRKENLQSCYNALLEDINKPRIPTSSSSTNKHKKSTTSKSSKNGEIVLSDDDDEQMNNIDFFDLSTRRKKF